MRHRLVAVTCVGVLAASLFVPATAGSSKARWERRDATYEIVTETDVPIKMSDGVTLYADIYRPAENGEPIKARFPVILTQTPYNKNSGSLAFQAPHLVERGYVQVIADVRGTGSSEGKWNSFGKREQRDGFELAKWSVSSDREWSNGTLGLYGTSYAAINQLFTAAQQPPGLKAIFPIVPMADSYRDIAASGGQINTSFIPLWLGLVTSLGALPPGYILEHPVEAAMMLATHAQGATEFQVDAVAKAATGGANAFDGPFYRTRSPIEVIDKVQVPTFITGGWFDLFQRGEPMLFNALQANGVPVKLVMGPWYHITAGEGLPQDGIKSLDDLSLRWFDHYMRGVDDPGLEAMPALSYFELGTEHYRFADTWPPPGVDFEQLYLSGPSRPGMPGTLESKAPKDQAPDVLPWHPASGVCSRSTVQWTAGGGEGSPCETDNEGNDVTGLSYDVSLPKGLEVAGPVAAQLFVGTNGRDTLLTVRVEDVDATGRSRQLTAGWNVLSLRALDESKTETADGLIVQPYHPFTEKSVQSVSNGKVYEIWVEVFPTAALFADGHSLRISIEPADTPHLGAPAPQLANTIGGVLSIYHDAKHASSVVVPIQK